MASQIDTTRLVKAATAGLTHELISRGFDEQTAAKAAVVYAHPQSGMLQKRANLRQQAAAVIVDACKQLRGAQG